MKPSNKTLSKSLIETTQRKDPKLFDGLRKMHDDLYTVFETLFDGPLPEVSGKNLILAEIEEDQLPDFIAFTDKVNTFTENQKIENERPDLELAYSSLGSISDKKGRIQQYADGKTLFSSSLYWDGSAFVEDAANGTAILMNDVTGYIEFIKKISGTFIKTLSVSSSGIVCIGSISDLTGAVIHELCLKNNKAIRAQNAAGDDNLGIAKVDANDIIQLGINAVSDATGHIAIPKDTNGNLPAAGANENGIIVLDTTNNRLCFYVGGNRYHVTGVSF